MIDISKMIIKTSRLALVPMGPEHFDGILRFAQDEEASRYMLFMHGRSEDEVRRFLEAARLEWDKEAPAAWEFAVCLGAETIGEVSVYLCDDPDVGELGWFLRREYWGCGYGSEAAKAVMEFSFDTLGLSILIARCDVRNMASSHIMEKLGMECVSESVRAYPDGRGTSREYTYKISRN